MGLLFTAEQATLTLLPFARYGKKSDLKALSTTMDYINFLSEKAMAIVSPISHFNVSAELVSEWPIKKAWMRIKHHLDLIKNNPNGIDFKSAFMFKQETLGNFGELIVSPSPLSNVLKYHTGMVIDHARVDAPYDKLEFEWNNVKSVFDSMNYDYFPDSGSLIGFMRYGSTAGQLQEVGLDPGPRIDLVDDDFDFWVRVPIQVHLKINRNKTISFIFSCLEFRTGLILQRISPRA